jgi:molecular chaperone DnaK
MVDVVGGSRVEVPLGILGENRLRVSIFDPYGSPIEAATSSFSITKTYASAAAVPATQTLAVKVKEGVVGHERNGLEPLIEKGTPLPVARKSTHLRAGRELKGGGEGEIVCELYQYAEGVPEPDLNLPIGEFAIRGKDIEVGQSIRVGDDVIFHCKMDENGILNVSVEIPSIEQTFDKGNFYTPNAGHRSFEGETGEELASGVLGEAYRDLKVSEEVFGDEAHESNGSLRQRLDEQQEHLEQNHDPDARRQVTETARFVRQELSRLRHSPQYRKTALLAEMNELLKEFNAQARDQAPPEVIGRMEQLAETVRRSPGVRDSFEDAELAIDQMRGILYEILLFQPSYLAGIFRSLCETRYLAIDKTLHDLLAKDGEEAIANNDVKGLRKVLGRMMSNRFEVGTNKEVAVLAGLMRA